MKNNKSIIQVALAGFGPGGRIYNAPFIAAVGDFNIRMILTSSQENIDAARKEFPEAVLVKEFDLILEDPEVDLVVISTPNHLHKEFAEKALIAGKHVVVEKPLTPTVAEAESLAKLAREKNRILSVNHNRRWDSDIRTVEKVIKQGQLGDIVEYEAHFDRFRPELKNSWKEQKENAGNGILYDLGSHLIDQALWLFGPPKEIFAHLRTQRKDSEVVDNFELLMLYPELKVSLKAGLLVKEQGPRYQVFGQKGSFIKSGMDVQEEALKLGRKPHQENDWGREPSEIWGKINTLEASGIVESEVGDYRKFYQNIAAAIQGKEELQVSPEQAIKVIKVIELAYKSHSEKRIVPF